MNTHAIFITRQDGNTIGDCLACEWYCESAGVDESARRHVQTAFIGHEGEAA